MFRNNSSEHRQYLSGGDVVLELVLHFFGIVLHRSRDLDQVHGVEARWDKTGLQLVLLQKD